MSTILESALDDERRAECAKNDFLLTPNFCIRAKSNHLLADNDEPEAADGVLLARWPLPPVKSFAELNEECSAEARAIVAQRPIPWAAI